MMRRLCLTSKKPTYSHVGLLPVLALQVWDLGGQANLRPSWQTYYKATDAVIMIVDSTDRARVGIAKVCSSFSIVCMLHPILAIMRFLRAHKLPGLLLLLCRAFQGSNPRATCVYLHLCYIFL